MRHHSDLLEINGNKKPSCCWDGRLMAPYQYYRLSQSWPWNDHLKLSRGQRSRCTFINLAMVNIFVYRPPGLGATVETICATFTFVTWKTPLKVSRGRRSRCNFINWAMVNIFVYRHPEARSSRWDDRGLCATFTFVTWKNPLKSQPRSKVKVYFY